MKHRFDKKGITQVLVYFSASFSMLEVSLWLNELARKSEAFRYVQQGAYVFTVILLFISVKKLLKLVPKTLKRAFADNLLKAVQAIAKGISKVSRKILSALGIELSRRKVVKPKDEKSFIFDIEEMNVFKKLSSFKSTVKWRDLNENSEKIRFIYVKYIIRRIKEGYKLSPNLTPCEVRDDLGVEDEDNAHGLFDMYNGARYSGGSVYITDEQVTKALGAVEKKSKKK